MDEQPRNNTGDFALDARPVANIGKRFYTWATLGTFSGASFLVSGICQTLKGLEIGGLQFTHLGWPLLFSAILVIAFSFATEPEVQITTKPQKVQKALITLANTLLVFFAVIGGTAAITGK